MSIETSLKALIGPLVAGGCHNTVNTSTTIVPPYVVFQEISGLPENTLEGYAGITRSRFQIDTFAKSLEQAKGLALGEIKDAIVAGVKGLMIFQMTGQYSELDKTFQYITEYSIWNNTDVSTFPMGFPIILG